MRLDVPTNRPNERPKKISINVGCGDGVTWVKQGALEIPIEDFPRALVLPIFAPPRLLTKDNLPDWDGSFWHHIEEADLDAFYAKYSVWPEIARVHPLFFARMIAKIAHSWTAGVEGINSFKPLLTDLILGKSELIRDYIGCDPEILPADSSHSLRTDYYRIDGKEYVGANVRLFGDFGAPQYLVIVGERLSGSQ